MAKVLLLEDDHDLADRLAVCLGLDGHTVESVSDGDEALSRLKLYHYDLAILDWSVPKLSGIEVCTHYRKAGGKIPILFLTAKEQLPEKEAGFDSGADDYVTKPFDMKELSLRVRAILRRPLQYFANTIQVGKLSLDRKDRKVISGGQQIKLSPLEFSLLETFMTHPHETFSSEVLLNTVWRNDSEATDETLRTYIKTLRKKIEVDGEQWIHNSYGIGYRFEP